MFEVSNAVACPGPNVAVNPQDKHVLGIGRRIVVITDDGSVFSHDLISDRVSDAHHHTGARVAANPQDKWVVSTSKRIVVVTDDGSVFSHELLPDGLNSSEPHTVGDAVAHTGARVAAQPQDKWVTGAGLTLFLLDVITDDGSYFSHNVGLDGNVADARNLPGPRIAANPQDNWVLRLRDRIAVITDDGGVFSHQIFSDRVGDAVHAARGTARGRRARGG